ncbi:MAG: murein L,D-transpeptidase [Gemmatimonadaceae bacterium]
MTRSFMIPRAARRLGTALFVALSALAACNKHDPKIEMRRGLALPPVDTTWAPESVTNVRGVPADSVRAAISRRLAARAPSPLEAVAWKRTADLYAKYADSPLWLDANGVRGARTAALLQAVAAADSDALVLSSYPLGALGGALAAARAKDKPSADALADADVLLTATYAALGGDYLTGQVDPKSMSQDWHINPHEKDVDSALVDVVRSEDLVKAIAQLRPQEQDYDALRHELQRFRAIVKAGGWKPVPAGRSLKPGNVDSAARLEALYDRLRVEGLLAAGATPPAAPTPPDSTMPDGLLYDDALAGAVAHFQATHGIAVDSVLGPGTIQALNVSAEYRLGQIAANLERYRWLPRTLGSRYIIVNVPSFRFAAYDSGQLALEMKVIVGAEYKDKNTPTFADMMEYVVFRPYWNVTPDIQAKEIEPKVATDPNYMEANDYEYWQDGSRTAIRQKPGPKNSLGLVKFMFPNDFNIYLHDTPARGLFEQDVRAFSHGCIRVEKPAELAQWVLGWSADSVQSAMNNEPNNKTVRVKQKIPVFIVYFTTYMADDELHFGPDLYSRDQQLIAAVSGGATPSDEALQAASALRQIASQLAA